MHINQIHAYRTCHMTCVPMFMRILNHLSGLAGGFHWFTPLRGGPSVAAHNAKCLDLHPIQEFIE
jgi:hypothetical protein